MIQVNDKRYEDKMFGFEGLITLAVLKHLLERRIFRVLKHQLVFLE